MRISITARMPDAAAIQAAAVRATAEIAAVGVGRVKDMLLNERDSRGHVGRKHLGLAHQLVHATPPVVRGSTVTSTVGMGPPRSAIVRVLEKGRRAGARMPPPEALVPWVRDKLGNDIRSRLPGARTRLSSSQRRAVARGQRPTVTGARRASVEAEVRSTAFLVARSIARRGVPGLHMFERTADHLRAGRAKAIYQRHLAVAIGGRPGRAAS